MQQVEGTTVVDAVQMTMAEAGDEPDEYIDSGVTQMTGNVLSYLERLDDEFYKSLQLQDPHTPEYVARLKDEVPLVNLMQDTLAYYDGKLELENLDPAEVTAPPHRIEPARLLECHIPCSFARPHLTAARCPAPLAQCEATARDAARVAARIVEHVHYREQSLFNTAMQNAVKRKQALKEAAETARQVSNAAVAAADEDDALRAEEDDDVSELQYHTLPLRWHPFMQCHQKFKRMCGSKAWPRTAQQVHLFSPPLALSAVFDVLRFCIG